MIIWMLKIGSWVGGYIGWSLSLAGLFMELGAHLGMLQIV